MEIKLRILKSKLKKNDETAKTCNTEFDFVKIEDCPMTRSIELELQNRKKHIFCEVEETLRGSRQFQHQPAEHEHDDDDDDDDDDDKDDNDDG